MVKLLLLMSRILHCTYATLFRKEAACGLVTLQFSDQYIFHLAFSIHYMIFCLSAFKILESSGKESKMLNPFHLQAMYLLEKFLLSHL